MPRAGYVAGMSARALPPLLVPPEPRKRRLRHLGALVAATAYGAALFGVYHLATDARRAEPPVAGGVQGATATLRPSLVTGGQELLAVRTLAARAQRSVYLVEGSAQGSGFVAWVQEGRKRSFVITARAVVAGLLADGGRTLYVKRGNRFWAARLVRADRQSGLALIRVDTLLERPLWQVRIDQDELEAGASALIVPPGPEAAFGEGTVQRAGDALQLKTGTERLYVGAPVVSENGRLAGVVVAARPGGVNRIVPIETACGAIRNCS